MAERVPLRKLFDAKFCTLDRLLKERDRRYRERFNSQERALKLLADQTRADKAQANEWRGALGDKDAHFVTKEAFQALSDRVGEFEAWRRGEQGVSRGTTKFFGWIVAGAGLVATLLAIMAAIYAFARP